MTNSDPTNTELKEMILELAMRLRSHATLYDAAAEIDMFLSKHSDD